MPLVPARTIYQNAEAGAYAVGGFDAEHIAMVKAIVGAAEETESPCIIFLWEEDIKFNGPGFLEDAVRRAAGESPIPIALMLDHGMDLKSCLRAIVHGHSGVMYDGSHYPYEENIARTRQVVEAAHALDVLVEGALGTIPRTFESSDPRFNDEKELTPIEGLAEYIKRTELDSIAVSIGSESGLYKEEPTLDFERLAAIRGLIPDVYLTLHGGSGIPAPALERSVRLGIRSVRFATELREAFFDGAEQARRELPPGFADTTKIFGPAIDRVKAIAMQKMNALGSASKARAFTM